MCVACLIKIEKEKRAARKLPVFGISQSVMFIGSGM
jgi:hypothetical protein